MFISCCPNSRLSGLALDPLSLAASFLSSGSGSSPTAGGTSSPTRTDITTSTAVTTQVSPQISPSFVQQSQSPNSPITTGATQSVVPMTGQLPVSGAMPGFDTPMYPVTPYTPEAASAMPGMDKMILLGALAVLGMVIVSKRTPRLKTYRSTAHALAVR
jgi:hypothetical protein